jgi:large subunit ribosomal protein L2
MKFYSPLTPSQRYLCLINRSFLWKGKPLKQLSFGSYNNSGRNSTGRITVSHRGGGSKKKYRLIDFKRCLHGIPALVVSIEFDPNRTSFIALVNYKNGICSYILAPQMLKPGVFILSGSIFQNHPLYNIGFSGSLKELPVGSILHNIEFLPGHGGQCVRAAGSSALLLKKEIGHYCLLRLSSGEKRLILSSSLATIGSLSNLYHKDEKLGKAGRNRWKGNRPTVRGMAMNPVDHPHGGATSGGRIPVTPWKKIAKGQSTRRHPNKWIFLD